MRVRLRDGTRAFLLIHIEIQSQHDTRFPMRLLLYHVTLLLHCGAPVTTLALLAGGSPSWKPGRAVVESPATRLTLEYGVCKLADLDPGPPMDGEPMLNHVVRAWRLTRDTTRDAEARKSGKIYLVRALARAARAEGCSLEEAAASLRFLETVAALTERNLISMEIVDLDVLTYGEKKAFRKGRQEGRQEACRESATRMRELGLDLPTIARALGVSQTKAASLLVPPVESGSPESAD